MNPGTVRRPTGDGGKLGVFAANALLRPVLTVERRKGLRGQLRPFSRWYTHATSLWGALASFVLETPVLVRATRCSGATCNLVSMRIDDVPATSQGLLRKKWILRQMETSNTRQSVLLKGRPISHVFHEVARSETRGKRQGVDV